MRWEELEQEFRNGGLVLLFPFLPSYALELRLVPLALATWTFRLGHPCEPSVGPCTPHVDRSSFDSCLRFETGLAKIS